MIRKLGTPNPYNNSAWRAIRKAQLEREPLCVNYAICGNRATVADHIVPLRHGGVALQSMCAVDHNRKRATSDKRKTQGPIVLVPPRKSTGVQT